MKVKVFQTNAQGKIEFTRAELEKLLNEVYDAGFRDGEAAQREKSTWTWTSPYVYNGELGTTTTSSTNMPLTINANTIQPIDKLTCSYDNTTNAINAINKNDISAAKNSAVDIAPISVSASPVDHKAIEKHISQMLESLNRAQAASDDVFTNLAKELSF